MADDNLSRMDSLVDRLINMGYRGKKLMDLVEYAAFYLFKYLFQD
jgi:hypothetical protein